MSVSLLSIVCFNWIQSEAHSLFEMNEEKEKSQAKSGDGKKRLAPSLNDNSIHLRFFPPFSSFHSVLFVCAHTHIHVHLSVHKHYPYCSTGKTFICMRNFLPFSSVCYSIQFKFLFFSHSPFALFILEPFWKHTQFKKWAKKWRAHTHTCSHREGKTETHVMRIKMSVKRII